MSIQLRRRHHERTARKVADEDTLLQAVSRMAAGQLDDPVHVAPDSALAPLAQGLDRMRQDIRRQLHELEERNAEVQRLRCELRYQIERRSELLVESLLARLDDDARAAVPGFTAGTLLAQRYRIGVMIGQGSMGVVYEVERITDGRRFAAKLLGVKPDYQTMARFAREAQLLARLQHPNLLAIVDADVTPDGVAYIIMELARGKSLAECYGRYGNRDFMLPILCQIAEALVAVHAAGVVHRDLKPGNVLVVLGADGAPAHAKLVDFGVSRLLTCSHSQHEGSASNPLPHVAPTGTPAPTGSRRVTPVATDRQLPAEPPPRAAPAHRDAATLPLAAESPAQQRHTPPNGTPAVRSKRRFGELTQTGMLLGTLFYMAPELRGGAHLAHPPADIFSFGVMTYEVLTGDLPFEELPLLRNSGTAVRFKPLITLCPGLGPELARTLESCLSVDPAGRPTAGELVLALQRELAELVTG